MLWDGFIKCCQRTKPQSYTVLLQLPPPQVHTLPARGIYSFSICYRAVLSRLCETYLYQLLRNSTRLMTVIRFILSIFIRDDFRRYVGFSVELNMQYRFRTVLYIRKEVRKRKK
jgi:hypothetical protein